MIMMMSLKSCHCGCGYWVWSGCGFLSLKYNLESSVAPMGPVVVVVVVGEKSISEMSGEDPCLEMQPTSWPGDIIVTIVTTVLAGKELRVYYAHII